MWWQVPLWLEEEAMFHEALVPPTPYHPYPEYSRANSYPWSPFPREAGYPPNPTTPNPDLGPSQAAIDPTSQA